MRTHRPGFSLIEGLLTIAILSVLAVAVIPMYRQYQVRGDLSNASSVVTQGVGRARVLAQSGYQDSPWGFSFEHGVLFKGESYDERDPAFDEAFPYPVAVDPAGTTEVWFEKLTGTPNAPGSIITLEGNDGQEVAINLQLDNGGSPVNLSDLVAICHHYADGAWDTIYVSDALLATYLAQGDTQGGCTQGTDGMSSAGGSSAGTQTSSAAASSAAGGGSGTPPAISTKGLFLLATTGNGSLNVSGNGQLTVGSTGNVQINSSNSAALTLSGNGHVTASHFYIVGNPGTQVTDNGILSGTVHGGSAAASDPLASLPVPQPSATQLSKVKASGNASIVLSPNTYQGITVSGNARVTLNPGFYYLNGGLSVSGNGRLTGSGVTIYTTNGAISLSGNGAVTLIPQGGGSYAGVMIFQDRTLTTSMNLSGNGSLNIGGAVYAANATITVTGNGAGNLLGSLVIGKNLKLSGNGHFSVQ